MTTVNSSSDLNEGLMDGQEFGWDGIDHHKLHSYGDVNLEVNGVDPKR